MELTKKIIATLFVFSFIIGASIIGTCQTKLVGFVLIIISGFLILLLIAVECLYPKPATLEAKPEDPTAPSSDDPTPV